MDEVAANREQYDTNVAWRSGPAAASQLYASRPNRALLDGTALTAHSRSVVSLNVEPSSGRVQLAPSAPCGQFSRDDVATEHSSLLRVGPHVGADLVWNQSSAVRLG